MMERCIHLTLIFNFLLGAIYVQLGIGIHRLVSVGVLFMFKKIFF